jgi:hypothetical protein
MMHWAEIDENTHEVKRVIKWDGVTQWAPFPGRYMVQHDRVGVGDVYDPVSQIFLKQEKPLAVEVIEE